MYQTQFKVQKQILQNKFRLSDQTFMCSYAVVLFKKIHTFLYPLISLLLWSQRLLRIGTKYKFHGCHLHQMQANKQNKNETTTKKTKLSCTTFIWHQSRHKHCWYDTQKNNLIHMFYSPAVAIPNQNVHMSWRKKKVDTHSLPGVHDTNNVDHSERHTYTARDNPKGGYMSETGSSRNAHTLSCPH